MAKETVIIDVEINENEVAERLGSISKSISDLKQKNSELKKELKSGQGDWAANSAEIAKNEAQIKILTKEQIFWREFTKPIHFVISNFEDFKEIVFFKD